MSRKVARSVWRDGQRRRRSPRIAAPVCQTEGGGRKDPHQQIRLGDHEGPPAASRTTRATVKRKLDQAAVAAAPPPIPNTVSSSVTTEPSSPQVKEYCSHLKLHESSKFGKDPAMPEKRMLELVIDVLQRRDTYEIFGEPVDPDEVENYYEIIKEPMDFGTMRAKLHEGMYENLDQFERDALLIPENAMHFNSRGTVYFRQARAIHDLAKKVFHVLRNEPEKFEAEFSGVRRRSSRRPQSDAKGVKSTAAKLICISNGDASGNELQVPKDDGKRGKLGRRFSRVAINKTEHISLSVNKHGRRFYSGEADSLCSDSCPRDSFHRDNVYGYTRYKHLKQLVPLKMQQSSYRESLLSFVKDLGPTAQMIAHQKLNAGRQISMAVFQTPGLSYQGSACFPSPRGSSGLPALGMSTFHDQDISGVSFTEAPDSVVDREFANDGQDEEHTRARKSICRDNNGEGDTKKGKVASAVRPPGMMGSFEKTCEGGKLNPNPKNGIGGINERSSSISCSKSAVSCWGSFGGNKSASGTTETRNYEVEDKVRPVVLALEHSRSNSNSVRSKKMSSASSSASSWLTHNTSRPPRQRSLDSSNPYHSSGPTDASSQPGHHALIEVTGIIGSREKSDDIPQASSTFTFDMPFLRAQLNQMNLKGKTSGAPVAAKPELSRRDFTEWQSLDQVGGIAASAAGSGRPFLLAHSCLSPPPPSQANLALLL